MKRIIKNFDKLLERFKIKQSTDEDVQDYIRANRLKSLEQTLKKHDDYSFLYGIHIRFLSAMRGLGFRVSLQNSKVILNSFSFATATIIVIGFTFTVDKFLSDSINSYTIAVIGKAEISGSGLRNKILKIKDEIENGKKIITGEKSEIVVQLEKTGIINVQPNSSVSVVSILKDGKTEFELRKGMILSKVLRLNKSKEYIVKTNHAIITVRGTQFSVSCDDNETIVALGLGKLNIKNLKTGGIIILETAKTATISDKTVIRPIIKKELLVLSKVGSLDVSFDLKNEDKSEFNEKSLNIKKLYISIDKKINDEFLKQRLSPPKNLKEIRSIHGRIDTVVLFSGREIKGVIISRGKRYNILTAKGNVWVKAEDVDDVITE